MTDRHPLLLAGALVLGTALTACGGATSAGPSGAPGTTASREQLVAEHSAEVMPFDLARTTHTFEPTADGLVETVVTRTPGDAEQVRLVREHLAHEATAFAQGNFDDPARIHGDDMPGLAELRSSHGRLTVRYTDAPDGGRITYSSTDAALVDALHRWGAAQAGDHGHEHNR